EVVGRDASSLRGGVGRRGDGPRDAVGRGRQAGGERPRRDAAGVRGPPQTPARHPGLVEVAPDRWLTRPTRPGFRWGAPDLAVWEFPGISSEEVVIIGPD